MSYILDALLKDKNQPQNDGLAPHLQQKIVYAEPQPKSHSIAWGVLLTLAIFAALALGFWLGQQGSLAANQVQQGKAISKLQPSIASDVAEKEISLANDVAFVAHNSANQALAMEKYFDNPPVDKLAVNPTTKLKHENASNVATTSEQSVIEKAHQPASNLTFDTSKLVGVSDELLQKVQLAVEDTKATTDIADDKPHDYDALPLLSDMPVSVQNAMPSLSFDMHIYASDGQGWVRVNGQDKYQGERINSELLLEAILPQHVVLDFQGQRFKLPAMSSW